MADERSVAFGPPCQPSDEPDSVEARLAQLARASGPLRRVLCALAGRLVARRGFERLGYARLGDYARERLGVSARTLQEFARVDARLAELPALEGALVGGRLPWSKVRLLARFATSEDELALIERAARSSVRRLERELRAVARGALSSSEVFDADEEGASREPTECVRVRVPLGVAFKWQRTRRHAAQVSGEETPAAAVLEWVTAEVLAGLPASAGEGSEPAAPTRQCLEVEEPELVANVCAVQPLDEGARVPAPPELPPFLRGLLEGLEAVDAFELDARLRRAVRLDQRLDAELAPALRQVTDAEHEWRGPYRRRDAYVREQLGISPRKARALLRLERTGDRCPELRAAYRDGALSWVQAQQLARLVVAGEAENPSLPAWIEWAGGVTVRRLEETVRRALLWRAADPEGAQLEDPAVIAAEARDELPTDGRQTCAQPTAAGESVSLRVDAPREVARLFRAALCSVRLALERETGRLPDEGQGFEAMLDHALRAWQVEDPWLRRRSRQKTAIFERDGWCCTVPGCTSRRNLHAHHIRFRSAGGGDEPENQTTLCAFHHQRGVHEGRVRVYGRAPDALWFELGVRQGRPPLVRYHSGC